MLALGALGTQSGPEGASDATPAIAPRPVVHGSGPQASDVVPTLRLRLPRRVFVRILAARALLAISYTRSVSWWWKARTQPGPGAWKRHYARVDNHSPNVDDPARNVDQARNARNHHI
jgi:hypothetical protein